jgi:hypothetical protein
LVHCWLFHKDQEDFFIVLSLVNHIEFIWLQSIQVKYCFFCTC